MPKLRRLFFLGVVLPDAEENTRYTGKVLPGGDVPLNGVGNMAAKGFRVADALRSRQQAPAETLTAQMTGVQILELVVGKLTEVDRAAEIVVVHHLHHLAKARHINVVNIHVGALVFNIFQIPEGEGVVVTIGEEDGTVVTTLEVCHADIVDGMAVVAVVVGPVADSQHQRSQQQKPAPTTMSDAVGTDANPNGESIEGEHISVVALTGLIAGVVEVEIENNAAEKEEQKDSVEIAPTMTPVAPQAPDSQQKRKHKGHDEIPLEVLASNEIIHQIAAVHIAELVCEPVF